MSTAEKIFQKAQDLPEPAQDKLLHIAEKMTHQYPSAASNSALHVKQDPVVAHAQLRLI